jgi:glucose-6-phosphate dehydrogenase assembly protein OpcA
VEESLMASAEVRPDRILKDLERAWQTTGDQGEDVLRACTMTLVALVEQAREGSHAAELFGRLMRAHPSRAIIITTTPHREPPLEAVVSVQCWMPFGSRQQICSEQIEIAASQDALAGVAPVLTGLIVPDLPVVLWSRSRTLLHHEAFAELAEPASKIIVDTGSGGGRALDWEELRSYVEQGRNIVDLNWTRITPWREAVARVFQDAGCCARAQSIRQVRIIHEPAAGAVPALYLGGWIASCLGWKWIQGKSVSAHGPVQLSIEPAGAVESNTTQAQAPGSPLRGVVLSGDDWEVSIRLGEGLTAETRVLSLVTYTSFPALTEEELVSQELAILSPDRTFQEALQHAQRLAAVTAGPGKGEHEDEDEAEGS